MIQHWGNAERMMVVVVMIAMLVSIISVASGQADAAAWTASEISEFGSAMSALGVMLQYLMFSIFADYVQNLTDSVRRFQRGGPGVIYALGAGLIGYQHIITTRTEVVTSMGAAMVTVLAYKAVAPWLVDWAKDRFGEANEDGDQRDYPPEVESVHEQYFNDEIDEEEFERRIEVLME